MRMKLHFWGASGNVTGSRYLLEANGRNILVDCGLYQEHDLKGRNWEDFQIPPAKIDCVLLTHAHLDHCGLLPRLVKQGFHGEIHCTPATAEIAKIVLADCAKINEEDAQFKRKRHEKEGRKGVYDEQPLYTSEEAEAVSPLFLGHALEKEFELFPGITVSFHEVGHILGATFIRIAVTEGDETRVIVFSGDVGRENMPLIRDPKPIGKADYLLCESTYGDRLHGKQEEIMPSLAAIVNRTVDAGGNLIIPSFAIERTQDLLYYLALLLKEDKIPHLQIYVDSPMAVKVTDVFHRNSNLLDDETITNLTGYRMPGLTLVRTIADSKSINRIRGSAIVIAGSGMCTGGRIKHHLLRNLPRKECTVLFIGYQAHDTLGRQIIDGNETVRVLGEEVKVAARVERISGFSAHADQKELLDWLSTAENAPRRLFVTHGEPEASQAFATAVEEKFHWNTTIPQYGDEVELD